MAPVTSNSSEAEGGPLRSARPAARNTFTRTRSSFGRWCWVAGLTLPALALALSSPADQSTRELISSVALAAAGVIAVASGSLRAAQSTGRRRRAWGVLALGGLVGLAGNIYAALFGGPEAGDTAYIIALLLGALGLSLFPAVRLRGRELVRMLLDSLVVGGSVLYIALFAVSLSTDAWEAEPSLTAYALPGVDALLATLAVLVMTRSSNAERVPLVLVGSGFVLYAVADVAFAFLSGADGFEFGSPIDVAWVGGYVAIALAARHPAASGSPTPVRPEEGSPVLGTVVTFSLFLAAAVIHVTDTSHELISVANVLWIAVVVAVVARQILLVVDNESLRHGLEQRVLERTRQLSSLVSERERTLESVADGIYGVDAQGRVTFVNAAAARTLGASTADLVGRMAHATFHAPAEDGTPHPVESCYITEAVRDGITTTAEQDVYLRIDGKNVPVEATASPLRDTSGIRGAVVAFRDVTERREMQRLKDEFVSVVSHELRTPLTAIRGALGLLDSDALKTSPEQTSRMIRIARTSSERLGRLVNDILDTERLNASSTQFDLEDHPVDALITAAIDQVSVLANKAGVVLRSAPTSEVVRADGERIVQTLTNLLGNAVMFSHRGSTVQIQAAPVGDFVEVHVDDEGRGIPPDKLEAVFRRFEQVDASDTRERGGSGLGLSIARSIVERHGGRIWAFSDGMGKGSSFRFTLRRATPHPSNTPENWPQDSPAATRVLVVDDDPSVVEVFRAVLQERGYDVVGLTDAEAALAVIEDGQPAAIVLDLAMPGTDGAEALIRLRQSAATAEVPVVVVSATRPTAALETAALADGWLLKPVDPARLIETVRDVIRRRPHHDRVLVVENDDQLREVVATILTNGGLAVTQASSVDEARNALAGGAEPDLVVLDLLLPDGSGQQLVADLRRNGRLRQIPLVVYSGADVGADEREHLALGHTVYLTKGRTTPDAVLGSVLDLLDAVAGRTGSSESSSKQEGDTIVQQPTSRIT